MSPWHEEYRRRYARLKGAGKSFFPHAVFKDALVAFLIFAALSLLAWKFGAGLESLADPTDATYNPRPEWYFLFLFQALKAFPGSLESVAAVVLPGAAVLGLLLLPLIDRGPERHPFDRPLLTGLGILGLIVVGSLTVAGLRSPLVNPIEEKDPLVAAGRRVYQDMNCAYCHKIRGKGGVVGPELDKVVGGESVEWLEKHFRDPKSVVPGSAMPQLHLLDDEIAALAAYMKSIGDEPFTKEAPRLFSEHCAACHKIGREGGESGPDLSLIGSARDKAALKRAIADPTSLNPAAAMPAFKDQLTDVQIEDLARYLSSLGR
ncbi:MAG: c-type cytochrome [Elusimicrobia bacterium]|nr:c-type cytochrome [Elusimicrobiota bacterium]